MKNAIRLSAFLWVLVLALGCGAANDERPTTESTAPAATVPSTGSGAAPGAGPGATSGAPAATSAANPVGEQATSSKRALNLMPMDVPAGTPLELKLETAVASDTSKVEQTVRATVARPVVVSGMTVIPVGAPVTGTVTAVERSGRVKGRASVAIRFNRVVVAGTPYDIRTARIVREAEATKGEDAKKIAIGAGAGAAIGAITGGKKGAAIGAGAGGGAGTGVVLATRGEEVRLPAGSTVTTTIQETVRITAPM
jgi:hypothetical protein